MWSFPGLLLLFYSSAFGAAKIVRLLVPWFWSNTDPHLHILITVTTIPEIDNSVYVSFIALFSLLFFCGMCLSAVWNTRFSSLRDYITIGAQAISLYILIAPVKSLYTLDQIHYAYLLTCCAVSWIVNRYWREHPAILTVLVTGAAYRFMLKPMITYDVGPNRFVSLFDYLYFGILLALSGYVYIVSQVVFHSLYFFERLKNRLTETGLVRMLYLAIALTLLFLMTKAHDPIDVYYTFLPSYHIVHGGVPFVSMMSQYGILYLVPWVMWVLAFPTLPVSFHIGVMVTYILLLLYFIIYVRVLCILFVRRIVFVMTAVSGIYFVLFMRYYGFPDPVSLVSTPAFTPLRFGIFMLPFWSLILYSRKHDYRFFTLFLVISAVLFFYSFETGLGIVLSALSIIVLRGLMKPAQFKKDALVFLGAGTGIVGVMCVWTFIASGRLPDFRYYSFFSLLYGRGFLMLPIDTQTVALLPVGVALISAVYGAKLLFTQQNTRGYLYWYLACMSLVELPYYMGRSVLPTLYTVSMPFIITCGMFVEDGLSKLTADAKRWSAWPLVTICGYILAIGTLRGMVVMGNNILHAAEIAETSVRFVYTAVTTWPVRESPQYQFLRKQYPEGCPFASFDDTYEYVAALRTVPAFNYPFMRGIISSKEQVDDLLPNRGSQNICFFEDKNFTDKHDDLSFGVYEYFWKKYGNRAKLVARDDLRGYSLYTISVR